MVLTLNGLESQIHMYIPYSNERVRVSAGATVITFVRSLAPWGPSVVGKATDFLVRGSRVRARLGPR